MMSGGALPQPSASHTAVFLQNGTCIVAGGSEAQNEETQELATKLIGCKAFNRSELHVQASASPHLQEMSLGNVS